MKKIYLILCLGFLIRLAGIHYGLPYVYHQDEPMMVNHALAIGTGDWNTHYFVIPPFVNYFLFMIYGVFYFFGRLMGIFQDPASFAVFFLKDPSYFYILGRFFTGVLPGVAVIGVIYKIGKDFFSEKIGLVAALLFSIAPLPVQQSHFIYADVPVTFAMTLFLLVFFRWTKDPSRNHGTALGIVLGWGTSIKYTMAYLAPLLILGHLFIHRAKSINMANLKKIFGIGFISLLVFALFAPYTFLDWPSFWQTVQRQSHAEIYVGLFHHLGYSLLSGSSILFLASAAFGIWVLWGSHKREVFFMGVFLGLFYFINTFFGQPFARYALPLVPILCLLAAAGWVRTANKVFSTLLILSLILPSIYSDILFFRKDTRTQCVEWVHKNLPENSKIALDNRFHGPPLFQTLEQIKEKRRLLQENPLDSIRRKRLDLMTAALENKKTYALYSLIENPASEAPEFLFLSPTVLAEWPSLKAAGVEYLVVNHTEPMTKAEELLRAHENNIKPIASFNPYRNSHTRVPPDRYSSTSVPLLWKDLFGRKSYGPAIEIYKLK